jgi:hypothetical protein
VKSKRTKSFRKLYDALPQEIQEQANVAYRLFRTNPAHASLDFKQVSSKGPTYSVRIGIHYRALAVRESDHWMWYWIGSHAEYDKLL